jgi:hypothetical protein
VSNERTIKGQTYYHIKIRICELSLRRSSLLHKVSHMILPTHGKMNSKFLCDLLITVSLSVVRRPSCILSSGENILPFIARL